MKKNEVYVGAVPSYVMDWCKKNFGYQYLTIEALADGVNVNIGQVAMSQSGSSRCS